MALHQESDFSPTWSSIIHTPIIRTPKTRWAKPYKATLIYIRLFWAQVYHKIIQSRLMLEKNKTFRRYWPRDILILERPPLQSTVKLGLRHIPKNTIVLWCSPRHKQRHEILVVTTNRLRRLKLNALTFGRVSRPGPIYLEYTTDDFFKLFL